MAAKKYRFVGSHADTLGDGRPVAPGDFVNLTDEDLKDPHNEGLAADGFLIGVSEQGDEQIEKADKRVERRTARSEEGDA